MTIAVAFFTIAVLIILHELGHFFAAKKFGVKVEEFGFGLPPRVWGRKFGETLYSINALPFGGFVRMEGEEKRSDSPASFSRKPLWQRFSIVAAGVVVFWIIAALIFAVLGATYGIPAAVGDEENNVANPRVRVVGVAADSPAQGSGLQVGDTITHVAGQEISKVGEIQRISAAHAGKEIVMRLERGNAVQEIRLTPREDPPPGEGPVGIQLIRAGLVQHPWYEAPWRGLERTWNVSTSVFAMFGLLISRLAGGEGLPPGTHIAGPVGVIDLLKNSLALGIPSFLTFVAVISVYLAIFNTLPIPALDGGRMFFLLLEGIRHKPMPEKLEQRLILISFFILIPLILLITANDIRRLL